MNKKKVCHGVLPRFSAVFRCRSRRDSDQEAVPVPWIAGGVGSADVIDEYAKKSGYGEFNVTHALASLLKERYGVGEYVDLDANDSAAVKADLTAPLDSALYGRWRCMYNGGTLEHIFDVAAAFKNVHLLLAEGGW